MSSVRRLLTPTFRYSSTSILPSGFHKAPKYNLEEAPFILRPSNRGKLANPLFSQSSYNATLAFQKDCLEKVNQLVSDTIMQSFPLYRVIHATKGDLHKALLHQYASQAWNMDFFLSSLRTDKDTADNNPSAELQGALSSHFGTFEQFKETFQQVANGYFGNGWIWLVTDVNKDLKIIVTHNGGTPFIFPPHPGLNVINSLTNTKFAESILPERWPILGLSLWEHSFVSCHLNKRENYVKAFWSAIDWKKVGERMKLSDAHIHSVQSNQNSQTAAPAAAN